MNRSHKIVIGVVVVVGLLVLYDQSGSVPVMEMKESDVLGKRSPKYTYQQFKDTAKVDPRAPINIPWVNLPKAELPRYLKYKESLLTPVINQGSHCAACWSISVTGMLADRISLYTNGKIKEPLSNQEMVSCWKHEGADGFCKIGGIPELAYKYIIKNGISLEKDYPYEQSNTGVISKCDKSKLNGYKVYIQPGSVRSLCVDPYRFKEGSAQYNRIIAQNVENMKRELFHNGPFVGTLQIYEDMYDYDGLSVYSGPKKGAKFVGGHAAIIYSLSEEGINGVEPGFDSAYWGVKNCWGLEHPTKSPSSKGYIFIKMGSNVCGIESRASRALPVIDGKMKKHMVKSLDDVRYTSYNDYVDDPERENLITSVGKIKGWYKK